MNFIAIDFETANGDPVSACALGLVVVQNGVIVKEKEYLLKPYNNWFSKYNVAVHGITFEHVKDAPRFGDIWHEIASDLENAEFIVAHNAGFDMNVMRKCLMFADIADRLPASVCTVKLAKKKLPDLYNHKLNTLAEHFGIRLNHHDALSDARAAALILLELNKLN